MLIVFGQVRGLWKQLDGFLVSEASEREVIESIVDRSLNKYRIDAAEIPIQVPDLLLRECEKEIRRVSSGAGKTLRVYSLLGLTTQHIYDGKGVCTQKYSNNTIRVKVRVRIGVSSV